MPSHRADAPPLVRPRGSRRRQQRRTTHRGHNQSLSVPQVGIASALGLATIAAPLTGALAAPPAAKPAAANVVSARAAAPALAFPRVAPAPATAVETPTLVPDASVAPAVPAQLAAPRTLLVTRASRAHERSVLPGCTGRTPDTTTEDNGRLPQSALCTLWDREHQLRSDAAVAIAKLNVAYVQRFGHAMCITDAYRSLAEQIRVKAQRGSFAAVPGTSEHGWGLAVDLCDGVASGTTPQYFWLRSNAPRYGFDNPEWARPGGSGPREPWHWEYLTGQQERANPSD